MTTKQWSGAEASGYVPPGVPTMVLLSDSYGTIFVPIGNIEYSLAIPEIGKHHTIPSSHHPTLTCYILVQVGIQQ